jgi:multisubunit Na+/H+ antiporter MnhG subunit
VTDRPTAPDRPARRPGLAAVLTNPAYRRLFAAQTVSRWGDTFNLVALVVLVFRLTGSGLGLTGAVIAEIAPVLLLAPAAGVLINRSFQSDRCQDR